MRHSPQYHSPFSRPMYPRYWWRRYHYHDAGYLRRHCTTKTTTKIPCNSAGCMGDWYVLNRLSAGKRLTMSEGTMIGPVTGGVLCDHTTWRWVFILNFPFCVLGFICTFLFVRLQALSQLTFLEKLQKTDWVGTILLTGGLVSLLIGLSWGGQPYAWSSVRTIAPIVVGIVTIIAFAFWQRHVAPTSLLPLSLFWCPSAVAAYYCALAHGLVVSDSLYPTYKSGARLLIKK
jgi:MFS family permease